MSDPLYQINVGYAAREDRLLLRVTTRGGQEFRIWLTRRYSRLLLAQLRSEMEKHGGAPTLAARPETRRMFSAGALQKSFDPDQGREYPLGEQGMLAVRLQAATATDGRLALSILPEREQGVTLNLDRTLLYLFHNVLMQGIEQAQWGLRSAEDEARNVH